MWFIKASYFFDFSHQYTSIHQIKSRNKSKIKQPKTFHTLKIDKIMKIRKSSKKSIFFQREFEFFTISEMILPQVHLRKPCYDFYFL